MGYVFTLLMAFYFIVLLISLVLTVFQIIALWKLYDKAGEPGWSILVPVYNFMKMVKIATGSYKLAWIYLGLGGMLFISGFFIPIIRSFLTSDNSMLFIYISCFFLLTLMIPLYIIAGYTWYMFAKAYGKSIVFCVLSIFFSGITFIIMGFDKSTQYVGPNGIPQYNDYYQQNEYY